MNKKGQSQKSGIRYEKKKVKFMLAFPGFKEKGEWYDLYKGFVRCLNHNEAFSLLIDDSTTGLKSEAIITATTYSIGRLAEKQITEFFVNAFSVIDNLKWPQQLWVAKLLFRISPYLDEKDIVEITKYFLGSNHSSFRYYGYRIVESKKLSLKKELMNAWDKYNDIDALALLIDNLTPKELFSLYSEAEEMLSLAEEDFEVLKLRNKYYSKIIEFIPKRLLELLTKDPVSYVFVMRDAGKKIDKDLALKIYKKNKTSRSLPACYGDLKQWNVLLGIYNNIAKNRRETRRKS